MTDQELRIKIASILQSRAFENAPLKDVELGYITALDIADALIAAGLSFDKTKAILAERANSKMLIQKAQYYDQMKHRAEVWKQAAKDMINTDICFGCHARATGICFKQNPNPETDECMNAIYKQAELESENASLRERLDKAVELTEPHWELCPYSGMYIVYYKAIVPKSEAYDDRAAAESRLAELKGEKK